MLLAVLQLMRSLL